MYGSEATDDDAEPEFLRSVPVWRRLLFVLHVSEPLGDIQRPRAVSWSKCAKERAQELRAGDLDWISGTWRLFEHCWEQNHEYRTKSGSWCWNKRGADPLPHPKAQSRKASLGASLGLLQKCLVLTNVGCFSSTQHLCSGLHAGQMPKALFPFLSPALKAPVKEGLVS